MLFRSLAEYFSPSIQPRVLPHLMHYIESLNIRRDIIATRFLDAPGYESMFIVLLRKILNDANIKQLLKESSDLDRYTNILQYTKKDLDAIYDSNVTGMSHSRLLIPRNANHTQEFLIPVGCVDPIAELPLDQGWDVWKTYRPIRLVDLDSDELTFNLYQDQIIFKKGYPSRVIVTIDVVALVLQYISFLQNDTSTMLQPEYLHKYVIVNLLADLEDVWLGNLYQKLITIPDLNIPIHVDIREIMGDHYYGYVGVEFPIILNELTNLFKLVKTGVITPLVALKSLRLSHSCIPTYFQTLMMTTSIEDDRQYEWMEYLRDRRWLQLLYDLANLAPEFQGTKTLKTNLRRDLPILQSVKIWSNAHDQNLRDFIQNDMSNWIHRLA